MPINRECPKCGEGQARVRHNRVLDELEMECTVCKYEWRMKPVDALRADKERAAASRLSVCTIQGPHLCDKTAHVNQAPNAAAPAVPTGHYSELETAVESFAVGEVRRDWPHSQRMVRLEDYEALRNLPASLREIVKQLERFHLFKPSSELQSIVDQLPVLHDCCGNGCLDPSHF